MEKSLEEYADIYEVDSRVIAELADEFTSHGKKDEQSDLGCSSFVVGQAGWPFPPGGLRLTNQAILHIISSVFV